MKRIISAALFALFLFPVALIAASSQPIIKIKGGATIFSAGTTAQSDYNLTLNEGQKITLTLVMGVREDNPNDRRVRFLQNFHTVAPYPTNTYNPDILIGGHAGHTDNRDVFSDHPTNPEQFGYRANNADYRFNGDPNHANAWNKTIDVVIEAKEDDDAENDTFRIQIPRGSDDSISAPDYYNNHYHYINGTVIDNDSVDYVIDPSAKSLTIAEGGSGSFKVKLDSVPSASVSVALTKTGSADVTFTPASLTFTTTNWNTDQTVTVNVADDDDAVTETATIKLSATGGNYDDLDENFTVNVTETDTRGITVSKTSMSLNEGNNDSFTVKLNSEPTQNTAINLTRSGLTADEVGLSSTSLAFTTSNWSTAQSVTVTANEDDDANDSAGSIILSSSGGDYGTENISSSVAVSVSDNDTVEIVHSSIQSIPEGSNRTFSVRLGSKPSGNVTVNVAQTGTSNSDITFAPTSLTFSTTNWNTDQQVTVTGADDDDGRKDTATIRLTASGADYGGAATKDVSVEVIDSETPSMEVSLDDLYVEEGSNATFTVELATEPSDPVTVNLAQSGTTVSEVTFDTQLTFTTANWNTAQTVTVAAAADTNTDDESVTIALTVVSADTDYSGKTDSVDVDVTDTTLVLILDPTSVSVTEGSTATFDVKLERDPGKAVTVTLTKTAASSSDITLSPSTLNFTTSNWSADQSVTVTAATDTDSDDDMATVNLTASDGDSQVTHSLNIRAKDNTPKMVVSSSSLDLDEEGTAGTVNVKLKAVQPAANQDVTVSVTSSYTGVTVSPSTLTFTNSNWETNQALTITAVADDNSIDEEVTITLDASGGAYDVARVDEEVEVDVSDNDTPDLTLSKSALTIVEGASDTIQAKLATEPSGNVTVSVASSNTEVSLDTDTSRTGRQDTLTFTKDNWSTNQNVHVATAHDDEATDDPATITFSFAGAEYDELDDIRISVTVDDDDSAGLTISALDAVIEGESKTFTVELSSDPLSQVNVDLAQTGTANADVSFSPDELIFTSGDWDTKQRVTVFAAEDDDSSQDRATIKLTASGGGSGANSYASITEDVTVRVTDDDTPGLRLSSEIVEVLEGTALGNTLKVRLLTQPTSNVTLNFVLTGSPDVKLDTDPGASGAQSTLIFTNSNWRTDRSVKITADTDEDSDSDTANIRISASGAEYAAVSEDVKVNVKDSTVDLKFVPENGSVSVDEGSFSTFTAVLSVQPEENVAVDLEQREPARSDVRFFPTNLIFTPSRWDTPQTLTVYADEDDNASGHYAFIDLETSGGGADYRNVTRTVTVMVQDPDVAALILEPTSLTVFEGIGTTFTVKLATDPIEDVEVAVMPPPDNIDTNDVRVYTGPQKNEKLVFTSENWDEPQTVTVTTLRDDDTQDAAVHITLKSTGGAKSGSDDYDFENVTIGMDVIDIDKPGLSLSHSSLEVGEGLDATFTVRLITKPSGDVTVKIDPLTNPDVTLDADPDTLGNQNQRDLTFTKTNWNMPQPVILSAARDLNANDETLTISMTASKGGYDHVEVDGKMVPVEASLRVRVKDKDEEGSLLSSFGTAAADAAGTITMTEGNETGFEVALRVPPTENVTVVLTSDNPDISFDPDRIVFTPSGSTSSPVSDSTPTAGAGRAATMTSVWNVPVRVKLTVAQDDDAFLETARIFMTASGGNYVDARVVRHLNIKDDDRVDPGPGLARPGDPLTWPVKSYAFAIPPASNGDQAAVRLQCKEPSENCTAFFDCTAQTDSRTYRGLWPRSIPPRGADVVALSDIAELVDDSPQRQGRLACVIRSQQNIVAQVWTRSGDGVLVNNSQLIHSDSNHEADIGTIPSLGTGDRSNIRIRCNKVGVDDCTGTRLECAEDDGTVHIAHIGAILRGIVRHVQTEELSELLDHEWDGLSLSCSVFSDQAFTVQILTRTGGGGALVNNSAVSAR